MKLLQNGNAKLKNMLVYSHTPVKGCLDCSSCASTCYAIKSYRQYPNVKTAWDRNLDLIQNDLSSFAIAIYNQLKTTKKRVVRIHASGDFISQEQINVWCDIAKEFPKIKFYGYSKSFKRLDLTRLNSLPNVNIIDSFIDGILNYGDAAHVSNLVSNHGCFLCPATLKNSVVTCGDGCDYCVSNNRVVFLQH